MPDSLPSAVHETVAEPSTPANDFQSFRGGLWIAAFLVIVLAATQAVELGDTPLYAGDIANHLWKSPVGSGNSLWEFGHLLWRPLGWTLLSPISPLLSAVTNWTPVMQAEFVLISVSIFCALVAAVLWYVIALLQAAGSRGLAASVAIAIAFSHGVLLYAHSGCAYVPGLTCLTASLYFVLRRRMIAGGLFFSLATLLWFPYILAGAALLVLAAWRPGASFGDIGKPDAANAIRFLSVSSAAVALVYALAIWARQISSVNEALAWYSAAGHGFSQNSKLLRMATGLPRSFLYLGRDGTLYKRFLLHDPYAPVTLLNIVYSGLWKLAAFYLFVICLVYEVLRRPRPLRLLLVCAAAAVPVMIFAVVLLEPSAAERYLPALPFLLLATVWALRDFPRRRRIGQWVIAGFLVCVILANGYSFAAPRVDSQNARSVTRVAGLRGRIGAAGLVVIVTNQDDLEETLSRLPFDNINRPVPLQLYDVVEPANVRVLTWRRDFAARAVKAWNGNGEVWISKRFWSPRPLPSWNWVEGDDPRVSWKDLPPFFAALNTDADSGGPDGFRRLARNEPNLTLLTSLAATAASHPYN